MNDNFLKNNKSTAYSLDYWVFLGYDNLDLVKNVIQNKKWLLPLMASKVHRIKIVTI